MLRRMIPTSLYRRLGGLPLGVVESEQPPEQVDFRATLAELLEGGFSTIARGTGPWIGEFPDEARILSEWSAHHPDGQTVALSVYKNYTPTGTTMYSDLQREDFPTARAYAEHVEQWRLTMQPSEPLANYVAQLPPANSVE